MTYSRRKYFTPSSLLASQTKEKAARARKSSLKSQPLTYSSLLEKSQYFVSTNQTNPQTAANRASALRAFLRVNNVSVEDIVGEELRSEFPDCLERYLDSIRAAGKKQRHITNLKSAMTSWRQLVTEWDTALAIESEKPTPFRAQLKELIGKFSIKRVATEAGVPYDMLLGWTAGKIPRAGSVKYLARLEVFFGTERGGLSSLTGLSHVPRLFPDLGEAPKIEYREMLGARTKDQYWLKVSDESPLRKQWYEFSDYKTTPVPRLERSNKGVWRISPLPMENKTQANWYRFHNGNEIPTAGAVWSKIAAYLGWCSLSEERGGAAIPEEKLQTLAWIVVPELLQRYVAWRRIRDGKVTTAVPEMLGWIQSMLREDVGFFPQSPWLLSTLPEEYRMGEWSNMCRHQFKVCRHIINSLRGDVEVSRDPFAPISHVVDLHEPLEALADMVQRMRSRRPIGNPEAEAIWARDIVLIKLLASNPLRMRQFSHMSWKPDNTGHLYQKSDGSWHIQWRSRYFKNARHAAGDQNYDCPVQESVWPDIEAYLFKFRTRLLVAPTDLVFIAHRKGEQKFEGHKPWRDISRRIQALTKAYLWRCPGVGGHSMRHLTGTAIIKAAPGDFTTVARVLNDRPLTVQKHYARFTSGDGARRMGELLKKSFKRM